MKEGIVAPAAKRQKLDHDDSSPQLQLEKLFGELNLQSKRINDLLASNEKYKFNFNVTINGSSLLFALINTARFDANICSSLLHFILEYPMEDFDWNLEADLTHTRRRSPLAQLLLHEHQEFKKIVLTKLVDAKYPIDWKTNAEFLLADTVYLNIVFQKCKTQEEFNNQLGFNNSAYPIWRAVKALYKNNQDSLAVTLLLIYPQLLSNLNVINDSSEQFIYAKISNMRELYGSLSRKFWAYSQSTVLTHGSLHQDGLNLILLNLIKTTFSHLLKDLPAELNDRIVNLAANNFQHQPCKKELEEQAEAQKNFHELNRENRQATAKIAVGEYRMQLPAIELVNLRIVRFNKLHTDIVDSALMELQKEEVIPSFLSAYHRSKIVQCIASTEGKFTKPTVLENLRNTFTKK